MFPPISIDLADTIQEMSFSKDEGDALSRYVLASLVDNYVREWEKQIDTGLHQTRGEYKKAIFQDQPDDFTIVLGMSPRLSKLGLMLEDGASTFDIKAGMAKSDKKKLGKNGNWYMTVPFKFATSDAVAESMSFANRMPKPIENLVKVMEPRETLGSGDIPAPYDALGQNATSGYNHKFSIYEGLQRQQIGSGSKENRGGYITFRRISENSDKDSWQHPGFEALHLMDSALESIDIGNIVDYAIDEFLANKE